MNSTPEIIGFLTWLYIPPTINSIVGLHGANVPLPIRIKVRIVDTRIIKPVITAKPPRTDLRFKTEFIESPIIRYGIKTAFVAGNKKETKCLII
jgi:hypothetical protein